MFHPTREETLRYAQEFGELATQAGRMDLVENLKPDLQRFSLGLFRLVVVGEIKKGKTSFINALLGQKDLLPVSSDIATSTVFKIYYGPEVKYKVFFKAPAMPDSEEGQKDAPAPTLEPVEIPAAEIASYGTEDGNPDNAKNVDFIAVEVPHPLLMAGLTIIDTPGLGGLFRKHADITWRYVPNADSVFFLTDSVEAVMTRDETAFLGRLREFTTRLFFVQTKIDAAEEAQWKAWEERNRAIIADKLATDKGKLLYFPVSSQLKLSADRRQSPQHLQRSGFLPLLEFINQRLIPAKDAILGRNVLAGVAYAATRLREDSVGRLRVAKTGDREKLAELEREFQDQKKRFLEWEQRGWPRAMEQFQDGLTRISSWAQSEFSTKLDATPTGTLISSIIERIQSDGTFDAQRIESESIEIQSSCLDACAQQVRDIYIAANEKIEELAETTTNEMLEQLDSLHIAEANPENGTPALSKVFAVDVPGNGHPIAITLIIRALLLGDVTTVVVTTITALTGIFISRRAKTARQREQTIKNLQDTLSVNIQKFQRHAYWQFNDTLTAVRIRFRDAGRVNIDQSRIALENRIAEIERARKRSTDETREAQVTAEKELAVLDSLLQGINTTCSRSTDALPGAQG